MGAARLAALAAARGGAGAVTMLWRAAALMVNAAHLTAIMLRRVDDCDGLDAFRRASRTRAYVLGPGFGDLERAREFALALLGAGLEDGGAPFLVLDADGITAFKNEPQDLFAAAAGAVRLALTPHEGEFARLFGEGRGAESKIERARRAARQANAVVVLKGPDTVIAGPDGRAAVNNNGTPFLATAGSGDVLAGLIGGLLAQGMPIWEAACAAAWIHAEAGARFGPGLVADDLPGLLPPVLRELMPQAG